MSFLPALWAKALTLPRVKTAARWPYRLSSIAACRRWPRPASQSKGKSSTSASRSIFGHHAARGIIAPDIEDHVLCAIGRPLHPQHPTVGLVHAVAADAEVPDWLPEVAGEVLLPGLGVADLSALGVAVAVGVDPPDWPDLSFV